MRELFAPDSGWCNAVREKFAHHWWRGVRRRTWGVELPTTGDDWHPRFIVIQCEDGFEAVSDPTWSNDDFDDPYDGAQVLHGSLEQAVAVGTVLYHLDALP